MASSVLLRYNGSEVRVNTTPNMLLQSIVETGCKKWGLDAARIQLSKRKQLLNGSCPVRYSSLLPNDLLRLVEMKKGSSKNNVVTVALQLGRRRLMGKFPASTLLISVVTQIARSQNIAIPEMHQPALVFMRTRFNCDKLAATTLSGIGISKGSVLFRLEFQPCAVAKRELDSQNTTKVPPEATAGVTAMDLERQPAADNGASRAERVPSTGLLSSSQTVEKPEPSVVAVQKVERDRSVTTIASAPAAARAPKTAIIAEPTAREALAQLRGACFDEDAGQTVLTLTKVLDNLLADPTNEKRRRLRLRNRVVAARIAQRPGGLAFLAAMGFQPAPTSTPDEPIVELRGVMDTAHLLDARRALEATAAQLRLRLPPAPAIGSAPAAIRRKETARAAAAAAPTAPTFQMDVYKSRIDRITPQPRGKSKTERELGELQSREAALMDKGGRGIGPGRRCLRLVVTGGSGAAAGYGNASRDAAEAEGGGTAGRSEMQMVRSLAAARHRKIERQKHFSTRAMRELESQRKKRVCALLLLRVHLPDLTVVEARFRPGERVEALVDAVRSWLAPAYEGVPFALHTSAPRTVVTAHGQALLSSLRLGSAARLYLTWNGGARDGSKGQYLRPQLLATLLDGVNTKSTVPEIPQSVPLKPDLRRESSQQKGTAKRKKKSKPAWLKL